MRDKPPIELLLKYAPFYIWDAAVKQANRSTFKKHRTGCVIFWGDIVYARGCSYKHDGGLKVNSVHAERHALSQLPTHPDQFWGGYAVVVTLTQAGNFSACSRPCQACAEALGERGIWQVGYAEVTNDGGWAIRHDSIPELLSGYLKPTRYAEGE